jgi:xylan 1,4-beta-xylosidase
MKTNEFTFLLSFFILKVTVSFSKEKDKRLTNNQTNSIFRYTNPITRDTSISMRDHCIIKIGDKW